MDTDSQLFEVKKTVNTSWAFAKKYKNPTQRHPAIAISSDLHSFNLTPEG